MNTPETTPPSNLDKFLNDPMLFDLSGAWFQQEMTQRLITAAKSLESQLTEATREIERTKADRNKAGMVERGKYLPKLTRLREALQKIQNISYETSQSLTCPVSVGEINELATDALNQTSK